MLLQMRNPGMLLDVHVAEGATFSQPVCCLLETHRLGHPHGHHFASGRSCVTKCSGVRMDPCHLCRDHSSKRFCNSCFPCARCRSRTMASATCTRAPARSAAPRRARSRTSSWGKVRHSPLSFAATRRSACASFGHPCALRCGCCSSGAEGAAICLEAAVHPLLRRLQSGPAAEVHQWALPLKP